MNVLLNCNYGLPAISAIKLSKLVTILNCIVSNTLLIIKALLSCPDHVNLASSFFTYNSYLIAVHSIHINVYTVSDLRDSFEGQFW